MDAQYPGTTARTAAWLVAGTAVLLGAGGTVVDVHGGWSGLGTPPLLGLTNGALLAVVALLILDQRPRHATAWFLLASGWLLAAAGTLAAVAGRLPVADPADPGAALAWFAFTVGTAAYGLGPVLFALFPAARLPAGRRARWAMVALAGFAVGAVTVSAAAAWTFRGPLLAGYLHVDQLPADPAPALRVVVGTDLTMAAAWLVGLVSIVVRFVRSAGDERARLSWAAAGAIGTILLCGIGFVILGPHAVLHLAALPLAAGLLVAMSRYRLFGIERLIRRVVLYAALTAGLAAVYGAVVVAASTVTSALGVTWSLAVAVATLAAAATFAPLRRGVQRLLDRHFDARAWQATVATEEVARRLRDGELGPVDLEDEFRRILGDPTLRIGYVEPGGGLVRAAGSDSRASSGAGAAASNRVEVPVVIGGRRVAVLEVRGATVRRAPNLLEAVLAAGALCLENASLHLQAAAQLAEVQESRSRIVASGDRERQRIERDLHDGAQQRLVALALRLRIAQRKVTRGDPATAEVLGLAVDELHRVLEELRTLTRGVLPSALRQEGLRVALRELTTHLPIPVRLDVTDHRLPPTVEATAWFIACEGLANAMKHSHATAVTLRVGRVNGQVTVEVRDDGRGGATTRPGGGLQGLADRVAAVRGRFSVRDGAPGTLIVAELPCGS